MSSDVGSSRVIATCSKNSSRQLRATLFRVGIEAEERTERIEQGGFAGRGKFLTQRLKGEAEYGERP